MTPAGIEIRRLPQLFQWRRPPNESVLRLIAESTAESPTYHGSEDFDPLPGWIHDRREAILGSSSADWRGARRALDTWAMFHQPWLQLVGGTHPPHPGQVVGILAPRVGLWWLSLSKVVRVYDESDEKGDRYGFVYATLQQHVVAGQELFEVFHDHGNGRVGFLIEAVSRPSRWFLRPGYPLLRRTQKRFALGALAAMREAVQSERRQRVSIHRSDGEMKDSTA